MGERQQYALYAMVCMLSPDVTVEDSGDQAACSAGRDVWDEAEYKSKQFHLGLSNVGSSV